jgi:GNAT superfamily N-acetyltransferase
MRHDDYHWAALALNKGHFVGIVTVTSIVYIEWRRLGEIGDLHVLPARGNGIARCLVQAAIDWCRARGCSAVEVTTTPLGEAAHGLSNFYSRLGFAATGRTISLLRLD